METQAKVLGQCISISLFLLWILSSVSVSQAHPIVQYWENETGSHQGLLLEPRVSYYSTTQNYNATSQAAALSNASSVTQMYFDLKLSYALTDDWYLFGRGSLISTKLKTTSSLEESTTGLGDQMIGTSYRVLPVENGFGFDLQFSATLPAYTNPATPVTVTTGNPYLGDGSIDMTTGAFIEIPIANEWRGEVGGAYLYRAKGYSAAAPWNVMIKRLPQVQGTLFSLGLRGQLSLSTDKTSVAAAAADSVAGAGGSELIGALNPSWLMAHGQLGYKTGYGQTLYALAGIPVGGTNSPKGVLVALGVQFDFGPHARPEENHSAQKNPTPNASVTVRKKKLSHPHSFTTYDVEAKVSAVNDSFYVIKIDKGENDGIEKGQNFDIFKITEDPNTQTKDEKLVGRATVSHLKNDEAALNVIEYYVDQWIEEGFTARRVVR